MFQPKVLSPSPDPWFVRELRRIDPNLRIVWAYERYLKSSWAIERKFSPERYFAMHASLLENDGPRFVEQPIFDTNSPTPSQVGALGKRFAIRCAADSGRSRRGSSHHRNT